MVQKTKEKCASRVTQDRIARAMGVVVRGNGGVRFMVPVYESLENEWGEEQISFLHETNESHSGRKVDVGWTEHVGNAIAHDARTAVRVLEMEIKCFGQ